MLEQHEELQGYSRAPEGLPPHRLVVLTRAAERHQLHTSCITFNEKKFLVYWNKAFPRREERQ